MASGSDGNDSYQCKRCGDEGQIDADSDRPVCPSCGRRMWPSTPNGGEFR